MTKEIIYEEENMAAYEEIYFPINSISTQDTNLHQIKQHLQSVLAHKSLNPTRSWLQGPPERQQTQLLPNGYEVLIRWSWKNLHTQICIEKPIFFT